MLAGGGGTSFDNVKARILSQRRIQAKKEDINNHNWRCSMRFLWGSYWSKRIIQSSDRRSGRSTLMSRERME